MAETFFRKFVRRWKELLSDRKYVISLISGFSLMLIALVANFYVARYTETVQATKVGDLFLDWLPTVDLGFFYTTFIFMLVGLIIIYPVFFQQELLPFTAKTFAAFILIRSFFISLTHLGPPEPFYALPHFTDQNAFIRFFYLNDLFFSGHTGVPFLAALIFWKHRFMRYFMLVGSVVMGVTVLLMHVHYSIDVFAAYFITYTIYVVSDKVFNQLNRRFRLIIQKIEQEERLLARMIRRVRRVGRRI